MDRICWPNSLFFSFCTLLIVISFHSLSSAAVTAPVSCLPDQRSALLQLKEGFIIYPMPTPISSFQKKGNLTSWQPGTNCCHGWEGVTCNESSGHVTDLDLSRYYIVGNLSVAIFNLTSLQNLNLAYNDFSSQSPIPNGFEKLTKLTHLNLSDSGFAGQIPIGIANLTNLVSLDLSFNGLRLQKPNLRTLISNLSKLRELHLDEVSISENGTEWCAALSESVPLLRALTMHSCNLSGPLKASFSRLHFLTNIDLSFNSFNCSIPDNFSNFPLNVLRLSSCDLTGSFPPKIFHIPSLVTLDISFNSDLFLILPNSIGNLQNLSYLDISSCQLSGQIPSSIGELSNLAYFNLLSNSLYGSIPQSLFALPNLETLNLGFNKLSGQFELAEDSSFWFSPLSNLDLNYNQLNGSIPRVMYKLSNLVEIDLSSNQLSGSIPNSIFKLYSLQSLRLDSNNFNGTFKLSLLQNLRNLTALYLSHNQLSVQDVLDEHLELPFPKVQYFGLGSCNLSHIPRLLTYHENIMDIDLSNNHLQGVIPSWMWEKFSYHAPSLVYSRGYSRACDSYDFCVAGPGLSLNLSYNQFTSMEVITACPVFLSCWNFDSIDLSSNKIKGRIPVIGAGSLDYSNNKLSEIPSNYTVYLDATVSLLISANRLSGEIPSSICKAPYLKFLDLSGNNLNGLIPYCILGASNLQFLNLAANKFQGIGPRPSNIQGPCQLLVLDLSNNNFDGELPKFLARCMDLTILNMENNHIVDTFPFWLGEIPNLQILGLRSNQFYGTLELPSKFATNNTLFQKLRVVDLASNNFHGSLPLWFESFKSMANSSLYQVTTEQFDDNVTQCIQYQFGISITIIDKGTEMTLEMGLTSLMVEIDLSNNIFSGAIPETIGALSSLKALNLSHNVFTGGIPHAFNGLVQIESLDLSWNNLSGEIPQELTSLNFLSKLNLSFNHLVGEIPQFHQFLTFDNSSFEGNPGLCGVPLSKQCEAAIPGNNSTSPSTSFSKKMTATVLLCLFIGLGFGTGFAIVIVYPVVKRAKSRQTSR